MLISISNNGTKIGRPTEGSALNQLLEYFGAVIAISGGGPPLCACCLCFNVIFHQLPRLGVRVFTRAGTTHTRISLSHWRVPGRAEGFVTLAGGAGFVWCSHNEPKAARYKYFRKYLYLLSVSPRTIMEGLRVKDGCI